MKPIIQIFIAIIILIACFKLGELKGKHDIINQAIKKSGIYELIQDFHSLNNPE